MINALVEDWNRFVEAPTPDNRSLVIFQGITDVIVMTTAPTPGPQPDQVRIYLPGTWQRVDRSVATVAPAGIRYHDPTPRLTGEARGWFVEAVRTGQSQTGVFIEADVAVEKSFTSIVRLSYSARVIGVGYTPFTQTS